MEREHDKTYLSRLPKLQSIRLSKPSIGISSQRKRGHVPLRAGEEVLLISHMKSMALGRYI